MENSKIYSEVKVALAANDISMASAAQKLGISRQNLSYALRNGRLLASHYKEIGKMVGIPITLRFEPVYQRLGSHITTDSLSTDK